MKKWEKKKWRKKKREKETKLCTGGSMRAPHGVSKNKW